MTRGNILTSDLRYTIFVNSKDQMYYSDLVGTGWIVIGQSLLRKDNKTDHLFYPVTEQSLGTASSAVDLYSTRM